MTKHAVTLKVRPCLNIECKFWLADDGWNASSKQPPVAIQAATFEQAKCDIESALAQHLELLLNGEKQARGRAA